jgi:hypothetical protein
MSGYRPDDDWAELTTESGEPLQTWQPFAFFAALIGVPTLVGAVGHFSFGRTVCLFIALTFFSLTAFSFRALRTGIRERYFEARQFRVNKADSPVIYSMYLGLHALLLPLGIVIGIACAAAVILNPFSH